MSEQDPRHWLRAESPVDARLADLLDVGRGEGPSAAQLQALAARLGPTFGGSGPRGGGGGASGLAMPLAALGIAAAVILLSGTWALRVGRLGPSGARPDVRPASALIAPAAPAPNLGTAAAREAPPPRTEVTIAEVRERHEAPSSATLRAARDQATELRLLEEAQRALAATPRRTLAATRAHAKRFPQSQYAQERELLAIDAMARLHERARARLLAESFLASYPGSSHARRVRALLARAEAFLPDADAGAP